MKKTMLLGAIICTILIAAITAYGTSPWPQFKGNAAHTGTVSHSIGCVDTPDWTVELDKGGPFINGVLLDADGNAIVLGISGTLYSVSPAGAINWSLPGLGSGNWGGIAYSEDKDAIYATCYGTSPEFYAIDNATGQIVWNYQGAGGSDSAPVIGPDGTIYYTTYVDNNKIYALTDNGSSGSLKWSMDSPFAGYTCSSMPLYNDGSNNFIFHASEGENTLGANNVVCIRDDGTQGTIIWQNQVGYNWAEGAVDEDGNYYICCFADRVGTIPYTAFKIDLAGNIVWQVLHQDGAQYLSTVTGAPSFSADGSRLYIGGHGGRLWCLDASDGSLIWVKLLDPDDTNELVAPPIVLPDGTVYAIRTHGDGRAFYRLWDAGDKPIEIFKVTGFTSPLSGCPAVADDGSVYMIPEDSLMYKFGPEPSAVEILTTSVPNGSINEEYYAVVVALGGIRPYAWTLDSGSLPPGLVLDGATGEITGTPTTGGTYNFVMKATDATTPTPTTDTVALSINVTYPPVKITKVGLRIGEKDASYSETITTNGAETPIIFSVVAGSLPPGISLSGDTLTGIPTAYGDYSFKIKAVAADATEDYKEMTIQVLDPAFWQMHQNTKRHIGTAAVAGPGEFIVKWSVGMNLGNAAPAIEGDYVYHMQGWPYVTKKFDAADGTLIYETQDTTKSHQRGTVALGTGVDDDKFFTCWGNYSSDAVAYYKADGYVVSKYSGGAGNGFQAYSNGRVYDSFAQYVRAWEVDSLGWSVVYEQNVAGLWMCPPSLFDTTDGEMMIFGSRDPNVGIFAVKVDTGSGWSVQWNNTTAGVAVENSCAIDSTNNAYFGGYASGLPVVMSIDAVTGELNWKTFLDSNSGSATRGTPALSYDQKTLYVQTVGQDAATGQLVAINTADGTVKWSVANGLKAGWDGTPLTCVVADKTDKVFYFYHDGAQYKVAAGKDNGTSLDELWTANIGTGSLGDATPISFSIGQDGTLYFACQIEGTGKLWAIKEVPPPAPKIIDMERGSMKLTFTSSTFFKYKIISSTSPYDYDENNMIWVTEADDIPGENLFMTWIDTNTPLTGEKYYKVVAKSATMETASETVGLLFVQAKVGRNMVSSPFEPYPAPPVISCGQQITGSVYWTTTPFDAFQWVVPPAYGTFEDDGTDQFVRTHLPQGVGYWTGYLRQYFEVEGHFGSIDATGGAILEFDCRYYQDPQDPVLSRGLWAYFSTYDNDMGHTYKGRAFCDWFYYTDIDPPYPAWKHVKIDLAALSGDATFSIADIDALTIITAGGDTIVGENWFDVKDMKLTYYDAYGNATLNRIVGNQLTGHSLNKALSDNIEVWDNALGAYKRAWYKTGTTNSWLDWDTGGTPAFGMDADKGYWFNIISGHPAKNVMLCGRVSRTDRSIPIAVGRNLVGSCFPVSCTLAKSGLVASGFTGHNLNKALSDNVEFWNNTTASYQRFWYKTGTTNAWQPWNVGEPMRDIVAGDAIWVNVISGHSPFTWTYPVPPRP